MTAPYVPPTDLVERVKQLLGRGATVVNRQGPSGDPYGEYVPPNLASSGDSVFITPRDARTGPPASFVLSHELGHRLYSQGDPTLPARFHPNGAPVAGLEQPISAIQSRNALTGPSEEFARAVSEALNSFGTTPYQGAQSHRANPADVSALRRWLLGQKEMSGIYQQNAQQPADATRVQVPRS